MGDDFILEAWTELAIAVLVIVLRLYYSITRRGWKALYIDDHLIFLAGIFYLGETIAAHYVVAVYLGMANNNILPEQRASLDPNSREWRNSVNGSKTHLIGWFMYIFLFWTLKACWTAYYTRLTKDVHRMNTVIMWAWIFNGSSWVAAICMVVFKCWPLHRQWQISPDPGNRCYPGASKLQILFVMLINTATDLFLMAIPVPIIYRAKIDLKRKISLIILFSGGWIVIIFGILRCVTLVSVGPTQPSKSGPWSVRESFLAIVISNGPSLFPLIKSLFYALNRKVSSYCKSSEGATYSFDNVEMDRGRLRENQPHLFKHRLSIRDHRSLGSEERIIGVMEDGAATTTKTESCKASLGAVQGMGLSGSNDNKNGVKGHNQNFGQIVKTVEWDVRSADRDYH